MQAPSFWYKSQPNFIAKLLSPFSRFTCYYSSVRVNKPKPKVTVPVICCGNLTVGGTGKTIVALAIASYLKKQGLQPNFLTRGYKRKHHSASNFKVDLRYHNADDVGDEALLLAQTCPTWIGSNRYVSAQKAIDEGANILIMDDGLQNPSLYQDLSIVIIDGVQGFGNQLCLPAGPCREPIDAGISRADACICIGKDHNNVLAQLPQSLPIFHSRLNPGETIEKFKGKQVIAFAGIGRPDKFFQSLKDNDVDIVHALSFPDHYQYKHKDLQKLRDLGHALNLPLLTTCKDYVKLSSELKEKITAIDVYLDWEDKNALLNLSQLAIQNFKTP